MLAVCAHSVVSDTAHRKVVNSSDVVCCVAKPLPHPIDSTPRDMPTSAASPPNLPLEFQHRPPRRYRQSNQHTHTIMGPTGDSEDLKILSNPSILVSRPSSSDSELSELSELSDSPSEPRTADAGSSSTVARSFGDVGELAAAGLVAQAVDQEVLEQEVAVKVLLSAA